MAGDERCPACGQSLEIRAGETTCPGCVGRFEEWCGELTRTVEAQTGRGGASPLGRGPHASVLLRYAQQWFNEGLTPAEAARQEVKLLGDLRASEAESTRP
jgi:hypothetical protein